VGPEPTPLPLLFSLLSFSIQPPSIRINNLRERCSTLRYAPSALDKFAQFLGKKGLAAAAVDLPKLLARPTKFQVL